MKTYRLHFICIILMVCLFSLEVFADGAGGWREPTPPEKAFHQKVLTTIQNALPSGPDGWREVIEPDVRELTRVYKGSESEPIGINYHIGWQDVDKKNAGDYKVMQAQVAFRQSHEQDPQVTALNKEKQELLDTSFRQAVAANDTVAMERCMKELDAIDAKLKIIYDRWDKESDAITAANEAHDVELEIWVRVNDFRAYDKMAVSASVEGNPVYRIPGGHIGGVWVGERNWVFLGKNLQFTESDDVMELKLQPSLGLTNTSARLIEVFVQADPERARQVLEKINWAMLKGLIK